MAYTQAMDEATPPGGANANTADDEFRSLKRDIKERLNSFFQDYNADPLTGKAGARITDLYMSKNAGGWASVLSNTFSGGVNVLFICADGSADGHYPMLPVRTILAGGNFLHNGLLYIESGTGELIFHKGAARFKVNLTAY
jgi:hypothetical protein